MSLTIETRGSARDLLNAAGLYNVKAWGAKGNGTSDDTTLVQKCLDDVNSAGGGVIYFPAGTYLISAELTYYSNISLIGAGKFRSVLKMANSFTTTNGALLKNSGYSGSGNDNVAICGLGFDGNKANNGGWTGGQVIVARANAGSLCNNITVDDCRIIDAPFQSLSFSRVKGVFARRNIIERAKRDSIVCYLTCENIHVLHNHLVGGADDHIALDAEAGNTDTGNSPHTLTHAVILGNTIRGPADAGAASGTGIVVRGAKNVVVAQNNIADVSGNGIFICDANSAPIQNIQVLGNQVRNPGNAGTAGYKNGITIAVGQSTTAEHPNPPNLWTTINSDILVAKNLIDSPGEGGIILRSAHSGSSLEDVQILGNRIKTPAANGGIQIPSGDAGTFKRIAIRYNKVSAHAGCRGILINNANAEKLWIDRNECHDGTGSNSQGIYIDNAVDVVFTGNEAHGNNSGGFSLGATALTGQFVMDQSNLSYSNTGANWAGTMAPPTVASVAGTITIPQVPVVKISGTNTITSITATSPGHRVTLIFTSTAGLTDGSNLKLNGNFTGTADDCVTLVCDGTNWFECSRSAN